jgi:hypothetical protein
MKQPLLGLWRIVEMELWEHDDIDMLRPAHIRFNRDGTGEFQFMTVQGEMDCRFGERDGTPIVEFSWCGCEEMDQSCGRGWATTPLLLLGASVRRENRAHARTLEQRKSRPRA